MEQILNVERLEHVINVFGSFDENIRVIEREFDVQAVYRDTEIRLVGEPENVMLAADAVNGLLELSSKGEDINAQTVAYVCSLAREGKCVLMPEQRSAMEAQARTKASLETLDETQKRLLNPHTYPVGLERGLYNRRSELVAKMKGFE